MVPSSDHQVGEHILSERYFLDEASSARICTLRSCCPPRARAPPKPKPVAIVVEKEEEVRYAQMYLVWLLLSPVKKTEGTTNQANYSICEVLNKVIWIKRT